MTPDPTDAEVLSQSLTEPARFEAIYERHLAPVHRYLRRRVGDDVAEDLTAEVFVRAFRARARYSAQNPTSLPWLFGIASNLIAERHRAERNRLKALERLASAPAADRSQASDEVYLDTKLSPELIRVVRKLAARDRDALLLVAWGELSYDETAEALGIPVGTVRSRIARARRQIRRAIGADFRSTSVPIAEGDIHV